MLKVIFLDFDGVANSHNPHYLTGYCGTVESCIENLNRIVFRTGAKLVISSSWRYMMLGGAMASMLPSGFGYLMKTHGIYGDLLGFIGEDRPGVTRGDLIAEWLDRNPMVKSYVVLDDEPPGEIACLDRSRLVKTDGKVGLTSKDADLAIDIFVRDHLEQIAAVNNLPGIKKD